MGALNYSAKDFPLDDIVFFNERLTVAANRLGLKKVSLGKVFNHDIWLVHPAIPRGPKLLFSAGFHGEEPAGVWGTLHFLETADPALFDRAAVSFLPLVNPSGIASRRRYNDAGENPNSNFCHVGPEDVPSQEGQLLLKNLPLLLSLAKNSFVSLHEDCDCSEFYFYTFEATKGRFSKTIYDIESVFFKPLPDDEMTDQPLNNGLIHNFCDGSFEDFLYHNGVPYTACTETPGKHSLETRVFANTAIINGLIEFFCKDRGE